MSISPSRAEPAFARDQARQLPARLGLLVQLKTTQRQDYFVPVSDVPEAIVR